MASLHERCSSIQDELSVLVSRTRDLALDIKSNQKSRDKLFTKACHFDTVMANVNNKGLTDSEFRQFVKNFKDLVP
jgi:hypothetical protein